MDHPLAAAISRGAPSALHRRSGPQCCDLPARCSGRPCRRLSRQSLHSIFLEMLVTFTAIRGVVQTLQRNLLIVAGLLFVLASALWSANAGDTLRCAIELTLVRHLLLLRRCAERLTKARVPITHLGIQGHLRGNTPLDADGLRDFCRRIRDLGLGIMVTELDVDTLAVPAEDLGVAVSAKYREFIPIMAPHISLLAFQALANDSAFPKKPDGSFIYSYLFDDHYHSTANCAVVTQALSSAANSRTSGQTRRS